METAPQTHGYAAWSALFLMRIGDLHRRDGDPAAALRTYHRAMQRLPMDSLSDLQIDPSRASDARSLETAIRELLSRYGETIAPFDPEIASQTGSMIVLLNGPQPRDWQSVQQQIQTFLEQQSGKTDSPDDAREL